MSIAKQLKTLLLAIFSVSLSLAPPCLSAESKPTAIRGSFFDFIDDPWKHVGREEESARFYPDGLLVLENGKVIAYGPYAEIGPKYPDAHIISLPGRLILPGFVDGHVHFAQTRVLGIGGLELLPWLRDWIYPEEMKYKDPAYARQGIQHYFENMLASGTTTVQDFGTSYRTAVEAFFDEASRLNMRVICGLAGVDLEAPSDFITPPEQFYADSKALIEKYHRHGRNLFSIVPLFALAATPELMAKCQQLHKEYPDCWVNTHVSENLTETRNAALLHGTSDYLGCYEKYGLVGPKFTAGHGVWLSDNELERLSKAGASIAFNPNSNLFLGNGLFRLGAATDPKHRVRLLFGTDMGGGDSFSMLTVLNQAYKVGMCGNIALDGSLDPRWRDDAQCERNKLNAYRAFYSLTLGGAQGLYLDDLIGNFNPGKEADFVVLDWNGGPPETAWHQSLVCAKPTTMKQAAQLLFGIMAVGDDRAVDETWVMGRRLYKKGAPSVSSP